MVVVTNRIDYDGEGLSEEQVSADPWTQIRAWVDDAVARQAAEGDVPEPLSISVATVDAEGRRDDAEDADPRDEEGGR